MMGAGRYQVPNLVRSGRKQPYGSSVMRYSASFMWHFITFNKAKQDCL